MLFPLQDAAAYLSACAFRLEQVNKGFRWKQHGGVTTLQVEPIEFRTIDGYVVQEIVTAKHSSPLLDSLPHESVSLLNRWATGSAIVSADDSGRWELVCKIGIFSDDRDAAERLYAPLICQEAAIMGWHAAQLALGVLENDSEASPLSGTNDPSVYAEQDFASAKEYTDRLGNLGTLSDGGFTVEFGWDPGAVSSMFAWPDFRERCLAAGEYSEKEMDRMAGRTTMLQIRTSQRHGLYGAGVLCTLELPLRLEAEQVGPTVNELNRWEMSGADFPPMFGAWCAGPRAPTFVTFIPNQWSLPGLLRKLAVWSEGRHRWARLLLTAPPTIH
jgi:hypothetical protein